MRSLAILFALFLGSVSLSTLSAIAQVAPSGSCLLPSDDWCWPIAPLTYGDPCECQLPDGTTVYGTVQ